jgi:hypothetical protein
MMFGQARSRSVLMGLDNHMITGAVPAPLSRLIGHRAAHDVASLMRSRESDTSRSRNDPGCLPVVVSGRQEFDIAFGGRLTVGRR